MLAFVTLLCVSVYECVYIFLLNNFRVNQRHHECLPLSVSVCLSSKTIGHYFIYNAIEYCYLIYHLYSNFAKCLKVLLEFLLIQSSYHFSLIQSGMVPYLLPCITLAFLNSSQENLIQMTIIFTIVGNNPLEERE